MRSLQSRRAFTLIELLVVVAIIALLIAILLPSLSKAKETVRRTTCAANLKAQGASFAIYAAGNKDFLPQVANPDGWWFHDQPTFVADQMLFLAPSGNSANGSALGSSLADSSVRKLFYCPSNLAQNVNSQWNNTGSGSTTNVPTFRVLGYAYLNDRGPNPQHFRTTFDATTSGQRVIPYRLNPPVQISGRMASTMGGSELELGFDDIVSAAQTSPDFITITGSIDTTSHVINKTPAGGNVLGYDGHVAWRKFALNSATAVEVTSANGWFWFGPP